MEKLTITIESRKFEAAENLMNKIKNLPFTRSPKSSDSLAN